jgi:hypothetical protein
MIGPKKESRFQFADCSLYTRWARRSAHFVRVLYNVGGAPNFHFFHRRGRHIHSYIFFKIDLLLLCQPTLFFMFPLIFYVRRICKVSITIDSPVRPFIYTARRSIFVYKWLQTLQYIQLPCAYMKMLDDVRAGWIYSQLESGSDCLQGKYTWRSPFFKGQHNNEREKVNKYK